MKRGIVIIPREEMNLETLEEEFTHKEQRHAMYMKEALKKIGIEPEIDGVSPWLWGKSCSEAGFVTLALDDFSILFLPETIDQKQHDWCYENIKMLSELEILLIAYCHSDQAGNLHFLTNAETDNILLLEQTSELIDKKYELYQKEKEEGVKVCMKV